MNRFVQYLNFAGVLVLSILCGFQWQANRRANLEEIALENARRELTVKVEEQSKTIKGLAADLEEFRDQLTRAGTGWKGAQAKLASLEGEHRILVAERDQLKSNVVTWAEAVAARDEKLKDANKTVQQISADRNETVEKFNALAAKHNAIVKDLNEALAQLSAARTNAGVGTAGRK